MAAADVERQQAIIKPRDGGPRSLKLLKRDARVSEFCERLQAETGRYTWHRRISPKRRSLTRRSCGAHAKEKAARQAESTR